MACMRLFLQHSECFCCVGSSTFFQGRGDRAIRYIGNRTPFDGSVAAHCKTQQDLALGGGLRPAAGPVVGRLWDACPGVLEGMGMDGLESRLRSGLESLGESDGEPGQGGRRRQAGCLMSMSYSWVLREQHV
jgi:hypothetical protein